MSQVEFISPSKKAEHDQAVSNNLSQGNLHQYDIMYHALAYQQLFVLSFLL